MTQTFFRTVFDQSAPGKAVSLGPSSRVRAEISAGYLREGSDDGKFEDASSVSTSNGIQTYGSREFSRFTADKIFQHCMDLGERFSGKWTGSFSRP